VPDEKVGEGTVILDEQEQWLGHGLISYPRPMTFL
jgi:hypothetical protein